MKHGCYANYIHTVDPRPNSEAGCARVIAADFSMPEVNGLNDSQPRGMVSDNNPGTMICQGSVFAMQRLYFALGCSNVNQIVHVSRALI